MKRKAIWNWLKFEIKTFKNIFFDKQHHMFLNFGIPLETGALNMPRAFCSEVGDPPRALMCNRHFYAFPISVVLSHWNWLEGLKGDIGKRNVTAILYYIYLFGKSLLRLLRIIICYFNEIYSIVKKLDENIRRFFFFF